MKKYTIHLEGGTQVSIECGERPVTGKAQHDLICRNEAGEIIAYFYTFLYWTEAAPEFAKKVPNRNLTPVADLPTGRE